MQREEKFAERGGIEEFEVGSKENFKFRNGSQSSSPYTVSRESRSDISCGESEKGLREIEETTKEDANRFVASTGDEKGMQGGDTSHSGEAKARSSSSGDDESQQHEGRDGVKKVKAQSSSKSFASTEQSHQQKGKNDPKTETLKVERSVSSPGSTKGGKSSDVRPLGGRHKSIAVSAGGEDNRKSIIVDEADFPQKKIHTQSSHEASQDIGWHLATDKRMSR